MELFETVPNFSVGRDDAVWETIAAPFYSCAQTRLLDIQADDDYGRTVLTAVGTFQGLLAALPASAAAAVAAIDLRQHHGVHIRMGAVDVVPIIPLGGAGMERAVMLSRQVGHDIHAVTGVPVFLYGASATTADHVRLPDIRRGGLQGVAARISQGELRPDFGHGIHPTAGATAVGARGFLIAYNIDLDTADPQAAMAIARTIRTSDGGLAGLQAKGVYLPSRGHVQVTCNLMDYHVTGLAEVYRTVERLAESMGHAVTGSEIVGLVPFAALAQAYEQLIGGRGHVDEKTVVAALRRRMGIHDLDAGRVLEDRLAASGLAGEVD